MEAASRVGAHCACPGTVWVSIVTHVPSPGCKVLAFERVTSGAKNAHRSKFLHPVLRMYVVVHRARGYRTLTPPYSAPLYCLIAIVGVLLLCVCSAMAPIWRCCTCTTRWRTFLCRGGAHTSTSARCACFSDT